MRVQIGLTEKNPDIQGYHLPPTSPKEFDILELSSQTIFFFKYFSKLEITCQILLL